MPKAGFEPARLAAPPPQDGVSASSTTSARLSIGNATSFPASLLAAVLPAPECSAAVVAEPEPAVPEFVEPAAVAAVVAVVSRLPG